jgi:transaldolase
MQEPYFIRVAKQTPTEFWINNPTRDQADLAITNGATGCTNNPSYSQKMVDHPTEGAYALKLLDEAIKESPSDDEAIAIFQRKLVKPISDRFLPIFKKSNEQQGFVSIQGDPIREDDPDVVIREALENRKLAPNICCKIPTTYSGLQAMEYLVGKDVPLNATEIFGIKQATVMCETYQKACQKTGKHPKLYISHIAGIYDDHLKNVVESQKINISPDILWQAGLAVARKLYITMEERGLPGTFIAGGARGLHHFTEMVGGKVCCTINWEGTADKLIEQNPPVVYPEGHRRTDRKTARLQTRLPGRRSGD